MILISFVFTSLFLAAADTPAHHAAAAAHRSPERDQKYGHGHAADATEHDAALAVQLAELGDKNDEADAKQTHRATLCIAPHPMPAATDLEADHRQKFERLDQIHSYLLDQPHRNARYRIASDAPRNWASSYLMLTLLQNQEADEKNAREKLVARKEDDPIDNADLAIDDEQPQLRRLLVLLHSSIISLAHRRKWNGVDAIIPYIKDSVLEQTLPKELQSIIAGYIGAGLDRILVDAIKPLQQNITHEIGFAQRLVAAVAPEPYVERQLIASWPLNLERWTLNGWQPTADGSVHCPDCQATVRPQLCRHGIDPQFYRRPTDPLVSNVLNPIDHHIFERHSPEFRARWFPFTTRQLPAPAPDDPFGQQKYILRRVDLLARESAHQKSTSADPETISSAKLWCQLHDLVQDLSRRRCSAAYRVMVVLEDHRPREIAEDDFWNQLEMSYPCTRPSAVACCAPCTIL